MVRACVRACVNEQEIKEKYQKYIIRIKNTYVCVYIYICMYFLL